MSPPAFVHLQVRSHYSLMRGAASLEALCRAARERGMTAIGLTDLDGLYGAVRFWEIARDAGLQPILGAEVTAVAPDGMRRAAAGERATLLVRTPAGYANLCRILTRRHLETAFSLRAALATESEGLVILSASPALLEAVREGRGERDLYLALGTSGAAPPGGGWLERLRAARRLGLEPVAVNDVHLVDAHDFDLHRMLRAIALNTTRDRVPPEDLASPRAWLKPPVEMERAYPHCPEAVAATARLAEECSLSRPPWGRLVFPRFADLAASGMVEDASAPDSFDLLRARCEAGARRRYGQVAPAVRARIDRELQVIREKGFADYFLVVQEIVKRSPRTAGRGSAAASIVSYCLGITHVEPIRHNLYFERFLNPGRVDPPDIDVDFCWDERDAVLDWVIRACGAERAAMIANHVTFRARAAVREVAKVCGLPDDEIARVTDRLSRFWGAGTAAEATRRHPLFQSDDLSPGRGGLLARPPWPEILEWATRLDGFPRHLSVHCGGVVIAPDGVDRHVPVERSAKSVRVIQWEKDQAEEAGLVKIDLLGNRSLSVIRDTCAALRGEAAGPGAGGADPAGVPSESAAGGVPPLPGADFDPIDDPSTQELMRDGETMGVFYVESPAMRQLQRKTRRGDFEHLVIHSSIIRPAANDYIREYVRRLRGGAYASLHPILDEVLTETYGIMCYQEDVARVAIRMAGFSDAEADGLRKVLSKKWAGHKVEDYRKRFFAGAAGRGIAPEVVREVWRMILSFSGYSFCKPHSASYALVSFAACYLKAHHPAEFMAAVISNGGGYYSTFAYVSECRRMGIEVRLPDINDSDRVWTGRSTGTEKGLGTTGAVAGSGAGPGGGGRGWVRVGLQQVKGMHQEAIAAIVAEKVRGGPFLSFDDFLRRAPVDPSETRRLIAAGAFDRIGLGAAGGPGGVPPGVAGPAPPAGRADLAVRPRLHWRLCEWEAKTEGRRSRERPLFAPALGPLPEPRPYEAAKLLRDEEEALGLLLSRHPLTLYRDRLLALRRAGMAPVRGCDLARHVGRRVMALGWLITGKVVTTREDEPMEFISFEDTTAIYETTFFPRTYERFCGMLTTARPYLLRGRVEEEFGAVTLTVDDVAFLDGTPGGRRAGISRAGAPVASPAAARPGPGRL
ncbi:MAG TPA: DNA polymerase III subunit alpha [Candidatus Polarisedimenticolia bacterium]|nr:DNA polymerase III subunit alpha [Candidatus Polarisedimenticolia bacterium]